MKAREANYLNEATHTAKDVGQNVSRHGDDEPEDVIVEMAYIEDDHTVRFDFGDDTIWVPAERLRFILSVRPFGTQQARSSRRKK